METPDSLDGAEPGTTVSVTECGGNTTKLIHMCLDVRGALMNYEPRDYQGMFKHDDGRPMTWLEAKSALMDELVKGHHVIPFGECDGFNFETGCPGHPMPAALDTERAEASSTVQPKGEGL